MDILIEFRKAVGSSTMLTIDSNKIELSYTDERGKIKIWFETENRSAFLHFNPQSKLASEYGDFWKHPKEVVNNKIFKQLNLKK